MMIEMSSEQDISDGEQAMVLTESRSVEIKVPADDARLPQAAWRTGPVFVVPARKNDASRPTAAEALLDYANFALDQEAQYCQQ
jgi:hypothetical protein